MMTTGNIDFQRSNFFSHEVIVQGALMESDTSESPVLRFLKRFEVENDVAHCFSIAIL